MYDLFYISRDKYSEKNWNLIKSRFPTIKKISVGDDSTDIYIECLKKSFTKMFWTIDDDIIIDENWNFDYTVPKWDQNYVHIWGDIDTLNKRYGSIKLWPNNLPKTVNIDDLLNEPGQVKLIEIPVSSIDLYDMFFVSYEEEFSDDNWNVLYTKYPTLKRIHGIKGIGNAHRACALQSSTRMFWSIDGDTVVDDNWNFSYVPPKWDQHYIHLWNSRNPINNLEYGYGAIKLWPTDRVINYKGSWLDFTTSVSDIKLHQETIATTVFNTSKYSTWKSAFRECVKLCTNISFNANDTESKSRLEIWRTVAKNDQPFYDWSLIGATDAISWYTVNRNNLSLINDFDWLKGMYDFMYSDS